MTAGWSGSRRSPRCPASNFGVTGIYCYDADVFGVIPTLTPSGRGELEITDVNNHYIDQGQMAYDVLEGFWGDAGESIEAYYAVNDFVRANGANGANGPTRPDGLTAPDEARASGQALARPALTAGRAARSRRCPLPSSPRLSKMSSALPWAMYSRGTPRVRVIGPR